MPALLKEFSPQIPVPLTEQVAEFLMNIIIEGRIKEGERLVENELQRELGVSRAPIREALRELEKKSLVVIIPRKGTFVRKINKKDIEENFTIRAPLEGLAARLALANMDLNDIKSMEATLSKMTKAVKVGDFNSYIKDHSKYHEIFINASKNDTLIRILEILRIQTIWYRFIYDYVRANHDYGIKIHREIIDLFIKKDADRLESLVKEHILRVRDWFLKSSVKENEGRSET